jgi:hypothetical protein
MHISNLQKIIFFLTVFFLFGLTGCASVWYAFNSYHPSVNPSDCYPNYEQSSSMDAWFGSTKTDLIKQLGPPDKTGSDDKGDYLLFNNHSLKEEFYINSKGAIFWWQWQQDGVNDNMDSYISNIKNLAYNNACFQYVPPNIQQAVSIQTAGTDFSLGNNPYPKFDPEFLNILGEWYSQGYHVLKDQKKAFQLFSISATFTFPDAEVNLGDCYRDGTGVQKDLTKARYWYQLVANQDIPEGGDARDKLAQLNITNPATLNSSPASNPEANGK